jgi:hypothetical protein
MPDVLRISELGPQEVKQVLQLMAVAQEQNMGLCCFWTLVSGKDEAKMAEESLPHAPGSGCWSPGAELQSDQKFNKRRQHVTSRVGWVFPVFPQKWWKYIGVP